MAGWVRIGWVAVAGAALATRIAGALLGPIPSGYDAVGHLSYVFFLDLYRAIPLADQGWSYFHPPLHYLLGWALAQLGSGEVLVRGLALLNGLSGLGVALLGAAIVRMGIPGRDELALLAFAVVAFLPVQLYASPMPGNELTATLLGVGAITCHLAARRSSGLAGDAATGALAGGALLAKYNGLVALAAIVAELALRALRPGLETRGRLRLAARAGVIVAVAALVCGGFYLRNVTELGTPFALAGSRPVVDAFEAGQPPGQRSWRDLVSVSPALFADPSPRAPHMLHSIWGTAWAGMWVHLDPQENELSPGTIRALLLSGVIPSLLAAVGFALSVRRVWRDREAHVEATLVLLTAIGLSAFAVFAFRVPTFAALKALYLLVLSPAWAYFIARAVAALGSQRWLQSTSVAATLVACGLAGVAYTRGLGLSTGGETVGMASVHAHFGEWDEARAIYRRELARSLAEPAPGDRGPRLNPFWLREMLAAVELRAGRPEAARDLYRESLALRAGASGGGASMGPRSPFVLNRLAVATALAGETEEALTAADEAVAGAARPEFLVNRGALRAVAGDLRGAEADLRRALELAPELAPALVDLAFVLRRRHLPDAEAVAREAARAGDRAPRGYPYLVGDGRDLNTQLFMLLLRDDGLALYEPPRVRHERAPSSPPSELG